MGVRDVAGIFSRLFVVGFFLPAFFTGVALDRISGGGIVPASYTAQPATRLLIVGAVAVLVGLLLSALHLSLLAFFAGRSLMPSRVQRLLRERWYRRMDRAQAIAQDIEAGRPISLDKWEDAQAGMRRAFLDIDWADAKAAVVGGMRSAERPATEPTRFGNALAAGDRRVAKRWDLEPSVVWPRVQALLTADQRQLEADARTELAFLTNACVGALGVGLYYAVEVARNAGRPSAAAVVAMVAGAVLAVVFYRLSADAANRWVGDVKGPLIDVTWRQLYEALGMPPVADSREAARTLTALLRNDPTT